MKITLLFWPIFYILCILSVFIDSMGLFIFSFMGIIITTFIIILKNKNFFNTDMKDNL